MTKKPLLIAIDGPAASGKGTLAKKVAEHFDLEYLDTGKIYRALGKKILDKGFSSENKDMAVELAKTINLQDMSQDGLYNEYIGNAASIVAAIPEVRAELLEFQRKVARSQKGAVLDGRDIGTVVCPEADFKFYITASIEARAERRYKQLQEKENSIIYQDVFDDLKKRDDRDGGRKVAPLKQASDAIFIDTTNITAEEVLSNILDIISARNKQ